jgi:hypothetical protein
MLDNGVKSRMPLEHTCGRERGEISANQEVTWREKGIKPVGLTERQKKAVASMWAAEILHSVGMDSFDNNVPAADAADIVNMVKTLATKVQPGERELFTLQGIISWVRSNIK